MSAEGWAELGPGDGDGDGDGDGGAPPVSAQARARAAYRMIGNAVCPPVIAALAGAVLAHLEPERGAQLAAAGVRAACGLAALAVRPAPDYRFVRIYPTVVVSVSARRQANIGVVTDELAGAIGHVPAILVQNHILARLTSHEEIQIAIPVHVYGANVVGSLVAANHMCLVVSASIILKPDCQPIILGTGRGV